MRIPRNTYRLQITHDFDLPTAARTLESASAAGRCRNARADAYTGRPRKFDAVA